VRLLWSLPKAAPALLRHMMAYAELAGQDLEQTKREIGARLIASVVLCFCAFFALQFGCLIVVAMTWDTPYRVAAVSWLAGGFLLIALVCGLYRAKLVGAQLPFLGTVRREWSEDRVILEKILSDQD
jgi:uncharacterized membrane protein YqjE